MYNVDPDLIESIKLCKQNDMLHYHISLIRQNLSCSFCGGKTIPHGNKIRLIHHPNLIDFNATIHWYAHRFLCKECRHTFMEANPFTFSNFSNSYAVMRRIMNHLKCLDLSFKRIAELDKISITQVQKYLDSFVIIPPRKTLPANLGIDEIHSNMSAPNSSYLCVMIDNETHQPFEILDSRSKTVLNRYFDRFPKSEKDKVKYVTIDMWEPYKNVALHQFKNCHVAVDPFHVVKYICDAFSKLRVNIMNQCEYGSDSYYLLKNWHFLLENTNINLDNEPVYNHRFHRKLSKRQIKEMLFQISDQLIDAYQLKEDYRTFNKMATYENAEGQLNVLIDRFYQCGIPQYYPIAQMLSYWKQEIIYSFERPYKNRKQSNSTTENMNNQIRAYFSVTRGSSNFTRFRKRVLFALNDSIFYGITSHLKSDKRQRPARGPYKNK